VTYDRVTALPLPQDGAVVLKLVLQPYNSSIISSKPTDSSSSSNKPTDSSAIKEDGQQHPADPHQGQLLQGNATPAQNPAQEQQTAHEPPPPPPQQQQQQQQQQAVRVVGAGKSAVVYVLMRPFVTPWLDQDSLEAWISSGAAIDQQQQQQQQQAEGGFIPEVQQPGTPSSRSSGVTVQVDGQQVEALEALIKQLLAENAAGKGSQ